MFIRQVFLQDQLKAQRDEAIRFAAHGGGKEVQGPDPWVLADDGVGGAIEQKVFVGPGRRDPDDFLRKIMGIQSCGDARCAADVVDGSEVGVLVQKGVGVLHRLLAVIHDRAQFEDVQDRELLAQDVAETRLAFPMAMAGEGACEKADLGRGMGGQPPHHLPRQAPGLPVVDADMPWVSGVARAVNRFRIAAHIGTSATCLSKLRAQGVEALPASTGHRFRAPTLDTFRTTLAADPPI